MATPSLKANVTEYGKNTVQHGGKPQRLFDHQANGENIDKHPDPPSFNFLATQ
jgi:hypothetical protein